MNEMTDAMTLAEFATLLDRYGPDIAVWPLETRTAAREAARQAEAQALLAEAERLDRMLDAMTPPAPSADLEARVQALAATQTGGHWVWMMFARPVWRPALFAAAMLVGVYLGAATLPTAFATADEGFDFATVAGGGGALGSLDIVEE